MSDTLFPPRRAPRISPASTARASRSSFEHSDVKCRMNRWDSPAGSRYTTQPAEANELMVRNERPEKKILTCLRAMDILEGVIETDKDIFAVAAIGDIDSSHDVRPSQQTKPGARIKLQLPQLEIATHAPDVQKRRKLRLDGVVAYAFAQHLDALLKI